MELMPLCHILQFGISAEQRFLPDPFIFFAEAVLIVTAVLMPEAIKLTLRWVWPDIVFCGLKQSSERHSLLLIFQCVSGKSDHEVCLKKLVRCG